MNTPIEKIAEKIDQQYLEWAERAFEEETGNFFWLPTNREREKVILSFLAEGPTYIDYVRETKN